nr:hypothetical protein [uncultured Blautia sp.]
MKKIKSIFSLLNPKHFSQEIHRYNADISNWQFVKFLLTCYVGLILFMIIFKLKIPYMAVILVAVTLFLPSVFLLNLRTNYEIKRFESVNSYLEQLLYSFRRQPKILTALQDTILLFQEEENSELREVIEQAIQYIQNPTGNGDVYEEALGIIEKDFGCKRMKKIHSFLRQVESAGGNIEESIEILLLDRNLWVDRITGLIMDKKKVNVNVTIAIGLSFLITAISLYMIPESFGIVKTMPSQISTTVVFLLNGMIWYIVQRALSGSLLAADRDTPFEDLKHAYDIVMHDEGKKKQKVFLLTGIMIVLAGGALTFFSSPMVGLPIAAFGAILATQPKRTYKRSKKKLRKEVQKCFPDWLLGVSLQLQTDNVHVSIMKSIPSAPELLQEELINFQDNLEKHPDTLDPYLQFFRILQISEISSAMKMLYGLSAFGSEDSQEQIKALVNRNTLIMDHAEKLRMEDELAGVTFAMLAPMITGTIKMVVDLGLVMTYVLSTVQYLG